MRGDAYRVPPLPDELAEGPALCREVDPDLFFQPDEHDRHGRAAREAQANAVCGACDLRQACLDYALDAHLVGTWGGTNEFERRDILRGGGAVAA